MKFPRFPFHEYVINLAGFFMFISISETMNLYMTHIPDVLLIVFNVLFIAYAVQQGYSPAMIVLRIIGRKKS